MQVKESNSSSRQGMPLISEHSRRRGRRIGTATLGTAADRAIHGESAPAAIILATGQESTLPESRVMWLIKMPNDESALATYLIIIFGTQPASNALPPTVEGGFLD